MRGYRGITYKVSKLSVTSAKGAGKPGQEQPEFEHNGHKVSTLTEEVPMLGDFSLLVLHQAGAHIY